jgi:hypothetical protein
MDTPTVQHEFFDFCPGGEKAVADVSPLQLHTNQHISLVIYIYFLFCRTKSVRDLIFLFDFLRGQLWSCGKVQHAEVKEVYSNYIALYGKPTKEHGYGSGKPCIKELKSASGTVVLDTNDEETIRKVRIDSTICNMAFCPEKKD